MDQWKLKIYKSIVPFGIAGTFVGWLLSSASDLFNQAISPILCLFLIVLNYLLWKKPKQLQLIEAFGFYGIMFYLLIHFMNTIWVENHNAGHIGTLGELPYWMPCLYILAFFIFNYRKALIHSFLFYTAVLIIPISHGIYDASFTDHFDQLLAHQLDPLLQFYLSNLIYIILLLYLQRMKEDHLEQATQIGHIFNSIDTTIWAEDLDKQTFMVSKGIEKIFGIKVNSALKKALQKRSLWYPEDQQKIPEIEGKISSGTISEHQFRITRPNKEIRWIQETITPIRNALGEVTKRYGVLTDITEQKRTEKEIEYLAYYDSLTGLSNRARFENLASHAIQQHTISAILFMDVDRFKVVNDTLGHNAGDQLLFMVSQRLKAALRTKDILSRYSGDEFLAFLPNADRKEMESIVQELMSSLSEPFLFKDQTMFLTVSIGVSFYPEDGESLEDLIKHADTAMYRAKKNGKDGYAFYNQGVDEERNEKAQLEADLRRAIEKQELELYYQPIVDLHSEQIVAAEALLRWNHSTLGVVSPADFIPLAEETGLIVSLGQWALREACRQNRRWQSLGYSPFVVNVNMSSRQFIQDKVVEELRQVLNESQLAPEWLNIEITESVAMIDLGRSIETMEAMKEMGLTLSMDDFGTGYSSLSYLSKFPLDKLKIDRSFIKNMNSTSRGAEIVDAIVRVAHSLQLTVVAEGVEQEDQLHILKELLCDQAQGYYFNRPLPAALFEEVLLKKQEQVT